MRESATLSGAPRLQRCLAKERVQRALILIRLLLNLMSTRLELLFTRETEQDNCVVPR